MYEYAPISIREPFRLEFLRMFASPDLEENIKILRAMPNNVLFKAYDYVALAQASYLSVEFFYL